jgi:chromosome segregation ATPase
VSRKKRPNRSPSPPAAAPAPLVPPPCAEAPAGAPWRLIAAGVVAFAALAGVLGYNHVSRSAAVLRGELGQVNGELRKDMARLGDGHAALTRKADHDSRSRSIWDALKDLRGDRNEVAALRERCDLLAEQVRADREERQRLAREVARLGEQQAPDGERAALVREVRELRERVARLQGQRAATTAADGE